MEIEVKDNLQLVKTILISGVGILVSYAISFLLTPYITSRLGIEAYGFVSIAKTATSYAEVVTIALTSFVVRYIAVYFHEGKIDKAESYYSTSVFACLCTSIIITLIASILSIKLDIILNVPDGLSASVKLLFIFIFISFAIRTMATPFGAATYIKNRLDLSGIAKIISYFSEAILLVLLFSALGTDVSFVGIGSISAALVMLGTSVLFSHLLTPELKFSFSQVQIGKVKELIFNGLWDAINKLGNILNSGLDLIVANLMLTATETGEIAVAKTVGSMCSTLIGVVEQPFHPLLIKSYSSGRINVFLKELRKAMIVSGFFGNVIFAGFFALGTSYYKLWLPSQNGSLLYALTVITLISLVTDSVLRPVYYIHTLTIKNKIPCWITLAGGVVNIVGMFLLIKFTPLGIYSIVVTTAVIMVMINIFFNPIYAASCLNIHPMKIYRVLCPHICSCVVMIIVFKGVSILCYTESWVSMIVSAVLMGVLGIAVHFLLMSSRKEKKQIFTQMISRLK